MYKRQDHSKSDKADKGGGQSDSIWGVIYGWAQALHVTPDYILHDISYENLLLYSQASPSYSTNKTQEEEWDDSIDANNPENFKSKTDNDDEEEEFV